VTYNTRHMIFTHFVCNSTCQLNPSKNLSLKKCVRCMVISCKKFCNIYKSSKIHKRSILSYIICVWCVRHNNYSFRLQISLKPSKNLPLKIFIRFTLKNLAKSVIIFRKMSQKVKIKINVSLSH